MKQKVLIILQSPMSFVKAILIVVFRESVLKKSQVLFSYIGKLIDNYFDNIKSSILHNSNFLQVQRQSTHNTHVLSPILFDDYGALK